MVTGKNMQIDKPEKNTKQKAEKNTNTFCENSEIFFRKVENL
jgi:hypothetical protein